MDFPNVKDHGLSIAGRGRASQQKPPLTSALCQKRTYAPQHTTHGLRALFDLIVGARELGATVRDRADTQCSWRRLSRPPWARRDSVPAGKRQRSFQAVLLSILSGHRQQDLAKWSRMPCAKSHIRQGI